MKKLNIGFMASHGGSNMQAVLDAINERRLFANPCLLISNNSKALAIERAAEQGMPYVHISQNQYLDLDKAILSSLKDHEVEYLLLVGYMKKLGPRTLKEYMGKIINIHPSLLPKYGGKGMNGNFVHEEVLKNHEKETGVTIHLVDEEYDQGRIINQGVVPVLPNDNIDTLRIRVSEKEHEALVETLIRISKGVGFKTKIKWYPDSPSLVLSSLGK